MYNLLVEYINLKVFGLGTSLVAQWLRICLPMQGTQVQSLALEDPTCRRAIKPVRHNYWACALEPGSHNYWACLPQLLKSTSPRARVPQLLSLCAATTEAHAPRAHALQQEKPLQWEARAPQQRVGPACHNLGKPTVSNQDPVQSKKKFSA